uniref:Syntaxin-18 n=1 Tax=Panagrolaimus superbus TaxID=310955 RepID=A0A914Z754_9BILA
MAVTDNTALLRARCKMIKTRQNALKSKEGKDNPEPIPPDPLEAPTPSKLLENSNNFRLFASQARDILRNISELRNLVLSKRRDYLLCSVGGHFSAYGHSNFISDYDRRQFDSDSGNAFLWTEFESRQLSMTTVFVAYRLTCFLLDTAMRQCGKLIKSLKSQMASDKTLREDEHKHLQCVIQLLSVYLKEVCRIVAQLREIHLKKTQNLQRICRLANLVDLYESNLSAIKVEEEAKIKRVKALEEEFEREARGDVKDEGWEKLDDEENVPLILKDDNDQKTKKMLIESELSKVRDDGLRQRNMKTEPMSQFEQEIHFESTNSDHGLTELSKEEQAQLLAENEELFIRFARTNTEIEKIETQMAEIKKLQDTFAEKIFEQEQEIEQIHVTTSHTLDNLEAANDFIRQAIQNGASRRVIMLFCLIVLTFTLLFLDWYNP